MKFAHIADCHLGGWRDPRMREVNADAFVMAIDKCLSENVDFVIISGDLFNTAIPGIESIRLAVNQLKRLEGAGMPVYGIPGSHDYSPSGKTMLSVLEQAGLFNNVAKGESVEGKLKLKFTKDPKTGALLTGIYGRQGGLDKYYYQDLMREHLSVEGFKIFCFHCGLAELKPKGLEKMEAMSASLLPANFDYYAGGHIHVVDHAKLENHPNIIFPGPTYPNNFAEIEKLRGGNFVVYDNGVLRNNMLQPKRVVSFTIDCTNMNPVEVEQHCISLSSAHNTADAIVTMRYTGTLREGTSSQINFSLIKNHFANAYFVMRNTYGLHSKEYEEIQVAAENIDDTEMRVIKEHVGQSGQYEAAVEEALVQQLIRVLGVERNEAMKKSDYDKFLLAEVRKILHI